MKKYQEIIFQKGKKPLEKDGILILWGEQMEKNSEIREKILKELEISHNLLAGKLSDDEEFWARNKKDSLAAQMMDKKAYVSLKEMIPSFVGTKVLNIGCGAGNEAEWLLTEGAEVVCTDISMDMMRLARSRFVGSKRKPNYYVLSNAENLPFKENSFDVALFGTSLHHIPRPFAALQSAVRVAKTVIAINEPTDMAGLDFVLKAVGWNTEYGGLETHRFNIKKLREYLEGLGCKTEIKTDFTWYPLSAFRPLNNSKLFVIFYYFWLKVADRIFGRWGHNFTLVATKLK